MLKQRLPYNILIALAAITSGFILLYNTVLRESYATTLRYSYPAAEEPVSQAATKPAEPRQSAIQEISFVELEEEPEAALPELEEEVPEENAPLTSVRFPLDINTATYEELRFIPQVGNVMAQRILQYRDYIGGQYTDLEQLRNISGVGDKTYERLWAYFYIGGDAGGSYSESDQESGGISFLEIQEDKEEE